ncbi:MAG TPA: prenyltransferase/squalene oxidase repeat-containing protein [Solirubrobacterales bacterium]|jgi:energy-coupling factor transport system substrate-specific component
MSWETASFLILGAVLLGGFAWYERSRPPSQVVALVAALAALAVAGRVAFAAIPNVVATTDIVIFSGYALGPAPGFAVGALGGLVSNFWLGQGPWTPWQMAGWGLCGIFGAGLALGGRRLGRVGLAAACALAGVLYGALLNFSLMATYGGDLSIKHFLALEARAIPFDAAHAIGNATLALVAGPAMVRALCRFRERFEWRPAAVVASLLLALAVATTLPSSAQAAGASKGAGWLITEQNSDGGWGSSPGEDSSASITAWVVLGLEAVGRNPLDLPRSGHTPIDYLRAHAGDLSSSGDFARTILAVEAAGVDSRSFGGRDLVEALLKRRRSNGSYEGWPGSTAFAIMALRSAGAGGSLGASISWLSKVQNDDGGWGDTPGSPSTAEGTAAVMQAMPDSKPAQQGLRFLRKVQRPSGGFAGGSGPVNSQASAWAVQGMLAVGADPASIQDGGNSALDYLAARQADDGHYAYSSSSDQTPIWVSGQVLPAVAEEPFPLPVTPRAPKPKPAPTAPPSSSGLPSGSLAPSGSPESTFGGEGGGSSSPGAGGGFGGVGEPPPSGGAPAPVPGEIVPEGDEPEPVTAPSGPPFEAKEKPGPKPLAPVGIGLASSGVALGSLIFLGRRFGW